MLQDRDLVSQKDERKYSVFVKRVEQFDGVAITQFFVQPSKNMLTQQVHSEKALFQVCGDYLCWVLPGKSKINVVPIKSFIENEMPDSYVNCKK